MKGCTRNEKYLVTGLFLFLMLSSISYALLFEIPSHSPYCRMEYSYGISMNFTAIKEKFEENGIMVSNFSEWGAEGINFMIPDMEINGTKYYMIEGYIIEEGYNSPFQPKYTVEMWLNTGKFPLGSYSDAMRYRELLRPSIELVKKLIKEATGYTPYSCRIFINGWMD